MPLKKGVVKSSTKKPLKKGGVSSTKKTPLENPSSALSVIARQQNPPIEKQGASVERLRIRLQNQPHPTALSLIHHQLKPRSLNHRLQKPTSMHSMPSKPSTPMISRTPLIRRSLPLEKRLQKTVGENLTLEKRLQKTVGENLKSLIRRLKKSQKYAQYIIPPHRPRPSTRL